MIDPSMDTVTPYTALDAVGDYQIKVADLENKLSAKTQQWEFAASQVRKYAAQIDSFEDALKHNEWQFDSDTLQSLADFFDITLEREYMVDITVRFSGTVTVPMDYDMDDLENELNAELAMSYYANSSVTADFMEENMDISYEEV